MEHLGLLHNQPVRRQQLHVLTGAFRAAAVIHHYDAFDADLTDLISRFAEAISNLCAMTVNRPDEFTVARFHHNIEMLLPNCQGGEQSRLLLQEWQDAEDDVWLLNSTINAIHDNTIIMFRPHHENKLVCFI